MPTDIGDLLLLFSAKLTQTTTTYWTGLANCGNLVPARASPSQPIATDNSVNPLAHLSDLTLDERIFNAQQVDSDFDGLISELYRRIWHRDGAGLTLNEQRRRRQVRLLMLASQLGEDKCHKQAELMVYHSLLIDFASNEPLSQYLAKLVANQATICANKLNQLVETELANWPSLGLVAMGNLERCRASLPLGRHDRSLLPTQAEQVEQFLAQLLSERWNLDPGSRTSKIADYVELEIRTSIEPECSQLAERHQNSLELYHLLAWFVGSDFVSTQQPVVSEAVAAVLSKDRLCRLFDSESSTINPKRVARIYKQQLRRSTKSTGCFSI